MVAAGEGSADTVALVRTVLAEVGLPRPWSVNDFLDRLEPWWGREIDLCAVQWRLGQSTGAWQRGEDHDVIAYPLNTTSAHQDHIIGHELGHMLLAHQGQCVLSVAEAQQLAPNLSAAGLGHLLNQSSLAAEEGEAEQFATLLLTQVAAPSRRPSSPLAARVEATFG